MQVAKHQLFHDGRSCRIETSPLICSANQWTGLCIIGTSVIKDSRRSSSTILRESVLTCCKAYFNFVILFFYLAFLSRIFTI